MTLMASHHFAMLAVLAIASTSGAPAASTEVCTASLPASWGMMLIGLGLGLSAYQRNQRDAS